MNESFRRKVGAASSSSEISSMRSGQINSQYGSIGTEEVEAGNIMRSRNQSDVEEEGDSDEEDELSLDDMNTAEISNDSGGYEQQGSRKKKNWLLRFKKFMVMLLHVDQDVWASPRVSRKQKIAVVFWLAALALSYASERASFKILVDHAGPFRMFAAEAISGVHAILLGLIMLLKAIYEKTLFSCGSTPGFPLADIGVMALLDTVQLLLSVISGSKIPPIFVVLLIQMVIPLTILFSSCFKKDVVVSSPGSDQNVIGEEEGTWLRPGYTKKQIFGAFLITLAIFVAMIPAFDEIYDPASSWTAYNSGCNMVLFLLSCVPAAFSTLYKEYTLSTYKIPVSPSYLNFVLALFQVAFTGIISPLVYPLQGYAQADDWISLYPNSEISNNFMDSAKCFFSFTNDDDDIADNYPESAQCNFLWLLLLQYVLSVMVAGVAVDKVIQGGAYKVMYRSLSVGVILAVYTMHIYDDISYKKNQDDSNVIDGLNLLGVVLLICGLDLYHRDPLSELSFETDFQIPRGMYEYID